MLYALQPNYSAAYLPLPSSPKHPEMQREDKQIHFKAMTKGSYSCFGLPRHLSAIPRYGQSEKHPKFKPQKLNF